MPSPRAHQLPCTGSCLTKCPLPGNANKTMADWLYAWFSPVFSTFSVPGLLIHSSAALLPHQCQSGRHTERPLGFSFLFLRPVNFHKAFNVRTSRLISRVVYSEPSTTAAIWLLRQGPRPQQRETLPDPSLNSPRCDLAEQIVWTLDGLCHNEMVSFLPER